jgi:hypothetical protein
LTFQQLRLGPEMCSALVELVAQVEAVVVEMERL